MRIVGHNFETCDDFHGRESRGKKETDTLNAFGERKRPPTTGFYIILSRIGKTVFRKISEREVGLISGRAPMQDYDGGVGRSAI
jgi:hypothetical protein